MTYDEFFEKYKPIKNDIVETSAFDGYMFETYGDEYKFVISNSLDKKVWTILEGDDDDLFISAGLRLVNRLGFFVTELPWEDENIELNID